MRPLQPKYLINLAGARSLEVDLSNKSLTCTDLSDAQLQHAILRETNFTDSNFNRANLRDVDLRSGNFARFNLEYIDFKTTIVKNADFQRASLKHSNLQGVDLTEVNLEDTNLFGVKYDENTKRIANSNALFPYLKSIHLTDIFLIHKKPHSEHVGMHRQSVGCSLHCPLF